MQGETVRAPWRTVWSVVWHILKWVGLVALVVVTFVVVVFSILLAGVFKAYPNGPE